jgi:Dolichyl-phosphate-mannose-protein mannosyltransferase
MLILLPVLTFFAIFLVLTGHDGNRSEVQADWRHAFLMAAVTLGGYMALYSEVLSLFHALVRPWMAACWGIALFATLWYGWRKGLLKKGLELVWQQISSLHRFDFIMVIILGLILLALFVVAVKSTPNNNDSLLYHMSRVMHWAQNRSLGFYPTAYEAQLINPIFAELSILNLRSLWGNDQVANLVQWFSMIGALIGVSVVAKVLGAGRRGQWAAVAFAASVPMGILQATSTQNDYVVGFLLITAVYFVALAEKRELFIDESVSLGAAMGLGILTKGTAYPYFLPVVIWFGFNLLRKYKFRQMMVQGLLITFIVVALNSGYWMRNIITYGSPLGPSDFFSGHTNLRNNPGFYISSLTKNILLNFTTPPSYSLNDSIIHWYRNTFSHLDPNAGKFILVWGWNHEDMAGSPLQVMLVPVTLALLFLFRKRVAEPAIKWYVCVALGTFLALVYVLKFDTYGMRYHLPFWIAFAPLFGVALALVKVDKLVNIIMLGLLLTALPYVIFNRTRPLISMRAVREAYTIPCILGCTSGSILNESPSSVLFANWTDYRGPYSAATDMVLASGCQSVGLHIDSHDLEYTFWWLLNAPQSGIHIESLDTYPRLQRYVDPNFKPCAIICTICDAKPSVHNLNLSGDFNIVRVYLGNNYDPQP